MLAPFFFFFLNLQGTILLVNIPCGRDRPSLQISGCLFLPGYWAGSSLFQLPFLWPFPSVMPSLPWPSQMERASQWGEMSKGLGAWGLVTSWLLTQQHQGLRISQKQTFPAWISCRTFSSSRIHFFAFLVSSLWGGWRPSFQLLAKCEGKELGCFGRSFPISLSLSLGPDSVTLGVFL